MSHDLHAIEIVIEHLPTGMTTTWSYEERADAVHTLLLNHFTPDEVKAVLARWCRNCGCEQPDGKEWPWSCQCGNDE